MKKKPIHPMEVHIGFKTFKIVHESLKKDSLYGYVDFATNTIHMDTTPAAVDYKGTLLHEVCHVALDLFGLGDDDQIPTLGNEYLATITSNMLQLLWGLNKELFTYIFNND